VGADHLHRAEYQRSRSDRRWDGYVLSGWWRRVGASTVDTVVLVALSWGLLLLFGFDLSQMWSGQSDTSVFAPPELGVLAAGLVASCIYFVPLMVRWDGRSIGKRALGIRVVRADHTPMSIRTVLVRQTLFQYGVSTVVGVVGFIDVLWPLWDREKRALHDMVAKTRVVRDRPAAPVTSSSGDLTHPERWRPPGSDAG
jgi:uncharacterized RDD family membrane protein YckC